MKNFMFALFFAFAASGTFLINETRIQCDCHLEISGCTGYFFDIRQGKNPDIRIRPDPLQVDLYAAGGRAQLGEILIHRRDPSADGWILFKKYYFLAYFSSLDSSSHPGNSTADYQCVGRDLVIDRFVFSHILLLETFTQANVGYYVSLSVPCQDCENHNKQGYLKRPDHFRASLIFYIAPKY